MIDRHLVLGPINKFLCATLLLGSTAFASLQVFPTRVLLSDAKKVTNISLRHFGEKEGQYRISAVFYRMHDDGNMEIVESPKDEERPLMKYLRFSPRTVTLAPKVEQVVRVVYRGPNDLPPGEYRAHLHFEPVEPSAGDPTLKLKTDDNINISLHAKIAVAVPVIFRHGNPAYEAKLSDLQYIQTPENKPGFSVEMSSTGNAYPFGDFTVLFTPKNGKTETVGVARSIASYREKRKVIVPQSDEKAKRYTDGTLRLEFRESATTGEGKIISSIEKTLP